MSCNCVCTCPIEVGDKVQYKLDPASRFPTIRINGGLDLFVRYIGTRYVIIEWRNKSYEDFPYGDEIHMTRDEFDNKIEKASDV